MADRVSASDRKAIADVSAPPRRAQSVISMAVVTSVDHEAGTARADVDGEETTIYRVGPWLPGEGDQVPGVHNGGDFIPIGMKYVVDGAIESRGGYDVFAEHGWGMTADGDFYANNAFIQGIVQGSVLRSAAAGKRIEIAERSGVWGLRFFDSSGQEDSFLQLWDDGVWLGFADFSAFFRCEDITGTGVGQAMIHGDYVTINADIDVLVSPAGKFDVDASGAIILTANDNITVSAGDDGTGTLTLTADDDVTLESQTGDVTVSSGVLDQVSLVSPGGTVLLSTGGTGQVQADGQVDLDVPLYVARRTSAQSLGNGTWVALTPNSTIASRKMAVSGSQIRPTEEGWYQIDATLAWGAGAGGFVGGSAVSKNGSSTPGENFVQGSFGSQNTGFVGVGSTASGVFWCNGTSDYLQARGFSVGATSATLAQVSVKRLRGAI